MPDTARIEAPRAPLTDLPTPLQRCGRLGARLGVDLLVKRDDLTGLGLGGNKVRKLEFLLGATMAEGCDTVVTFGALQSNHARQTAAACAALGLHCELVLTRAVPLTGASFDRSGNVLLDELFGATVHVVPHDDDELARTVESVRAAIETRGSRARWVPPGGSDPVGTLGYVLAGLELAEQARALGLAIADVVLATSTGGTQAGLVTGLRLGGCDATVHGVAVYRDGDRTTGAVRELTHGVAKLLDRPAVPDADVVVVEGWRGEGYGIPTDAMWDAVATFARTEALVLDPVYSGKAAAMLLDGCAAGRLGRDGAVAFVHTGGSPGLFAYADRWPGGRPVR
jgi:L-cysteate sulfo-lyase